MTDLYAVLDEEHVHLRGPDHAVGGKFRDMGSCDACVILSQLHGADWVGGVDWVGSAPLGTHVLDDAYAQRTSDQAVGRDIAEATDQIVKRYRGALDALAEGVPPAPVAQPLSAEEAIRGLLAEVQYLCPNCRTPKQAATRNGYRCSPHRIQYVATLNAARSVPDNAVLRAAVAKAYSEGYGAGLSNEVDDWNASDDQLAQWGRDYADRALAAAPASHRRGCPLHVHATQRDPTVTAICMCDIPSPEPAASGSNQEE